MKSNKTRKPKCVLIQRKDAKDLRREGLKENFGYGFHLFFLFV